MNNVCKEHWYDSLVDVATCNVVGGKWEKEANSILLWASDIWDNFSEYKNNLNDETAIGVDDYLKTISNLKI